MTDRNDADSSGTAIDPPSLPAGLADDIPEDPRIVQVVHDYLRELEEGRIPDRALYIGRYPELALAVAQCLEGLDLVHAESQRQPWRSAGDAGAARSPGQGDRLPDPLGDFRIVRELARGGMGVVYEAVQLSLGRRVALKVLPFAATLDARHLQRFKTEAQAAALLHHTNIVPVFAVGCERGVHFYAMQLIDGQSLSALIGQLRRQAGLTAPDEFPSAGAVHSSYVLGLDRPANSSTDSRRKQPPPPAGLPPETTAQFHAELSTHHAGRDGRFFRTAARLMLQAAHALEHAHEFGIIHRDIKPANLLLDVQGVLWVADFGLAQFHAEAGLTRTGDIPGTLRYMSPEQAAGQRALLDRRTDVYSLGATFYELLTLEPIFKGRDTQYLLHQILHAEPRSLRQIDKTIPVELETIVLKSVSKNVEDRYRSAGDLAADLERYLGNQPILARRPSLVDRTRKWSRRHPAVIVGGLVLATVVAVGLLISNHREKLRANEAEQRFLQARQAVDVLIEVSEDELAENPGMQWTRQRLLGIALGYYQDFIEQRRGDAAGQAELAAVQLRVKGILREMTVLQKEIYRRALENNAVQEALELSPVQTGELAVLQAKWKLEWESDLKDIWDLAEDARRRRMVVIAEAHDRDIEKLLSARQRQRLSEIVIQYAGLFAFKHPEVAEALHLTAEQRKAIREIERQSYRNSSGPSAGHRPEGMRDPGQRVPKSELVDKVVALLDEGQVGAWHKLIGEPFRGIDQPLFKWAPGFGAPEHRTSRAGPPHGGQQREDRASDGKRNAIAPKNCGTE